MIVILLHNVFASITHCHQQVKNCVLMKTALLNPNQTHSVPEFGLSEIVFRLLPDEG